MYHYISSPDILHNNDLPCSSHQSHRPSLSSTTPSMTLESQASFASGRKILQDILLSRRVAGIRASVFRSSESHLRKLCLLHGLDVTTLSNVRYLKVRL